MINGIIKLFYSELVKSKMKSMPNKEYSLKEEYKVISNVFNKIDNIFSNIFKILFSLIIVLIALNINTIFGVGTGIVLTTYTIYKLYIGSRLENKFKNSMESIKNNIEETSKSEIVLNIKPKIYSLISLLLIGLFSGFNSIIIICFAIVFIFTIKDIYSNINK